MKGLDDKRGAAAATIATRPALYKTGTFAALAEAYDTAGASEQAEEMHRLALLEPFFRSFARLGVGAQQRHLETLAGPERAMAEAIMNHQADAFSRDPYAAGTALYPDVGPPLPVEDAEGRLTQARMIEARRGVAAPVQPDDEIAAPAREPKPTTANLALGEEARPGSALSDPRSDVASGDGQIAQAEPTEPPSTASRRGAAPPTEPPPNDQATEKAFQDFEGENLLLSNEKWVVDANSPTGYVITPFKDDLKSIAAAAKRAKAEHPDWELSQGLLLMDKKTRDELEAVLRANLGQAGTFDYQRRRYPPGKDGLTQLRQFRSIANINVGLFCQQLGLSLDQTLWLAGYYAVKNSSNRNFLRPRYFLDSDTEKYIRTGYEIGAEKLFE